MRSRFALSVLALLSLAAGDPPPSDVVAQRSDLGLTTTAVREMISRTEPSVRAKLAAHPAALAVFRAARLQHRGHVGSLVQLPL